MEPRKNEPRIEYLARVLHAFMEENDIAAECKIHYDGAMCDGACLAEDIINELGIDMPGDGDVDPYLCDDLQSVLDAKIGRMLRESLSRKLHIDTVIDGQDKKTILDTLCRLRKHGVTNSQQHRSLMGQCEKDVDSVKGFIKNISSMGDYDRIVATIVDSVTDTISAVDGLAHAMRTVAQLRIGGPVPQNNDDDIQVALDRGWWQCRECGAVFENFANRVGHACKDNSSGSEP